MATTSTGIVGNVTPWIDAATAQPTRQSNQWLSPRTQLPFIDGTAAVPPSSRDTRLQRRTHRQRRRRQRRFQLEWERRRPALNTAGDGTITNNDAKIYSYGTASGGGFSPSPVTGIPPIRTLSLTRKT